MEEEFQMEGGDVAAGITRAGGGALLDQKQARRACFWPKNPQGAFAKPPRREKRGFRDFTPKRSPVGSTSPKTNAPSKSALVFGLVPWIRGSLH